MTKSTFSFAAVGLAAVLLSACIKIDVAETIDKTGTATFVLTYDFSGMADAMKGVDTSSSDSSDIVTGGSFDDFNCTSFLKDMKEKPGAPITKIKNLKCVDKTPNVIEISGTTKLPRRNFVKRQGIGKTIYMLRSSELATFTDGFDEKEANTETAVSDDNLGKDFLQVTMKITMPGKIVKAPFGTIQGNTLLITTDDLPTLEKNTRGFIRSEE
jgi:hypothetical protein